MIRIYIAAVALSAVFALLGAAYHLGGRDTRRAIDAASDRARIETLTESDKREADVEKLDDDGLRDALLRRVPAGGK